MNTSQGVRLRIEIPGTFSAERKYTLDVLFGEILGIPFEAKIKPETKEVRIYMDPGKPVVIEDHFFHRFRDNDVYWSPENVPGKTASLQHPLAPEGDLPVLFGNPHLEVHSDHIRCGADLIASAFFLLTRWEEAASPIRDRHNRFPASASLAFKSGLLDRPLVNEYREFLRSLLQLLKPGLPVKERRSQVIFTHDVDYISRWRNRLTWAKTLAADLIKYRNFKRFLAHSCQGGIIEREKMEAWEVYNWLMDLAESRDSRCRFYFASGRGLFPDPMYRIGSPFIKKLIRRIKERGHIAGFHPGYHTADSGELWRKEFCSLKKHIKEPFLEARQHYLRFSIPETGRIWEENGLTLDSSCGYADREGFRCGTGDEFPLFDRIRRTPLSTRERPLIIMDSTLFEYRKMTANECEPVYRKYLRIAEKYRMPLTLLFHPERFYRSNNPDSGWRDLVRKIFWGKRSD